MVAAYHPTEDVFQPAGSITVDGHVFPVPTNCQQHRPTTPLRRCGPQSLFDRSYTLQARWPLPPFHLVMEQRPGTCDLYLEPRTCCAVAGDFSDSFIEGPVREAIAAFLSGCVFRPPLRRCQSLDLGANNGWMTAYMLALGSDVVAVEPAADLAAALSDTIELNCWSQRARVINAFACDKWRRACMRNRTSWINGHRAGYTPQSLRESADLQPVGGVLLPQILTSAGGAARHWDLIKLDGDGPEGKWMGAILRLLDQQLISVDTIITEQNFVYAVHMQQYQKAGFHVWRLDFADERRFITSDGWDAYSPPRQYQPLGAARGRLERDELEDEILFARGMRRVFRVHDNLTLDQWRVVMAVNKSNVGLNSYMQQFVLTRHKQLLEPRWGSVRRNSPEWRSASPEWLAAQWK